MQLLLFLADAFIDTFGITRPGPELRRRAAFAILGMLVLTLVGTAAVGYGLFRILR